MAFDLAAIIKRATKTRRRSVTFRAIKTTKMQAQGLFAAAYRPVLEAWETLIPRIVAEYERSLSALTTDSAADIGREFEQADTALTRLFLLIRPALNRWAIQTEEWHRGQWRGAVLSATGVDINTLIGAEGARETIAASLERNAALIKNVSDTTRGKISDAVFRGLSSRTPAREVSKIIQAALDSSRQRAINIASDQTVKIASALDVERRREAGIDKWKWRHSGKVHGRPEHIDRDGEIFSDDDPPEDMPGELPFCGCTSEAVVEFE